MTLHFPTNLSSNIFLKKPQKSSILPLFLHLLTNCENLRGSSQKVRQGKHPDIKINQEKLYFSDEKDILNPKNVFE